MNYEVHLIAIGALLIVLSLVHLGFPKYLDWKNELARLSALNRQVMQVHTFFIALVVLFIGLLCLSSSTLLTTTVLGKRVSMGLGVFWSIRLLIQLFGYSSTLWRRKTFETVVHCLFILFWVYLSAIFLMIGLSD